MPFASQDDLDLFGDTDAVPIANPLRAEEGFLRTRLTPGLLHAAARNLARGVGQVALFEVGTTFRLADPFTEHGKLGFVLTGPAGEGWFAERRAFDVLDATGILAAVLDDLGVGGMSLGAPLGRPFHPGRSAAISIGGRHAGVVGEIHPRVAEALEIDGRVAVCVVGLGPLREGVACSRGARGRPTVPARAARSRVRPAARGAGGLGRGHAPRGRRSAPDRLRAVRRLLGRRRCPTASAPSPMRSSSVSPIGPSPTRRRSR